jgi:hypothetical protein
MAGEHGKGSLMSKFVRSLIVTILMCGLVPVSWAAAAETDKATQQQAIASCKAQVKEYAKYNETSWWQRHTLVQKCVKDASATK